MAKLGDLYFDVLLRDMTDTQIKEIKKKISGMKDVKVKVGIDKTEIANDIRDTLNKQTFKVKVVIDKASVSAAVQKALDDAGLKKTGNFSADDARRAKSDAYVALQQQKIQTELQKTLLAQQKLNNAQKQGENAAKRAANANSSLAKSLSLAKSNSSSLASSMQTLKKSALQFVGAFSAASVIQRIVQIRGEFERQEVALNALMQSASQATTLFNNLQALAIKSPYQFNEMLSFTKQLAAFQIPNRELYDTTKRLADLSSGLGVDMGRIILAYGQVRAATILKGTELRQFTEAGVPMVQLLADKFSALEGRVVTTGEVMERITKRLVPFSMVKEVIDDMTSAGGKFFDMQAKQAETLYGKVSNLQDAYEVMVNQIGRMADGYGLFKAPLTLITNAMNNWQATLKVIVDLMAIIGAKKMYNFVSNATLGTKGSAYWNSLSMQRREMFESNIANGNKAVYGTADRANRLLLYRGAKDGVLTQEMGNRMYLMGKINKQTLEYMSIAGRWDKTITQNVTSIKGFNRVAAALKLTLGDLKYAFTGFLSAAWPMLIIGALTDIVSSVSMSAQEIKDFNSDVREQAKSTHDDISSFLQSHEVAFNMVIDKQATREEAEKAWEEIKVQLEKLAGGDEVIARISMQDDVYERVKSAKTYMDVVEEVTGKLKDMESTLRVTQDIWHGIFGEGVKSDLQDFVDTLNYIKETWSKEGFNLAEYLSPAENGGDLGNDGYLQFYKKNFDEANAEIAKSLQGSLMVALDEVTKYKSPNSPEFAMAIEAAYKEVMPKILQMMGATSEEAKSLVESVAQEMMADAGYKVEDAVFMNENTLMAFITRIKDTAKQEHLDLNRLIINNDTERLQEVAEKTLANAKDVTGRTYDMFKQMASNISKLKASIQVILNIGGADKNFIQTFVNDVYNQKHPNKGTRATMSKMYGVMANSQAKSLHEFEAEAQAEYKRLTEEQKDNDRILRTVDKNTTTYKNALENQKKIKEGFSQLENVRDDFAISLISDKDKKKNERERSKADSARKKEETARQKRINDAIKDLKREYNDYKNAVKEIKAMNDSMGKEKTEQTIKDLGLFNNLNKELLDKYVKGGVGALAKDYLSKIKYNNEAAQNLRSELEKDKNNDALDAVKKGLKKQIDNLKEVLKLADDNWKMYDKLLEKTGDMDFSALFGLGNIDKLYSSLSAEKTSKFNKFLKDNGYNITYDSLLMLDANKIEEQYGKDIRTIFEGIKDSIDDRRKDLVETMADAIADGMSLEDKITMKNSEIDKFINEWFDEFGGAFDKLEGSIIFREGSNGNFEWLDKLVNMFPRERQAELKGYIAELKKLFNELNELKEKSYEASDAWKALMEDFSDKTTAQLEEQLRKINKELKENSKLTKEQKDKLQKQAKSINDQLNSNNPFRSLVDGFKKLKGVSKDGVSINEVFGNNGNEQNMDTNTQAMGQIFAAISKITAAIKECADAFANFARTVMGDDAMGDYAEYVGNIAGGMSEISSGMSEMMSGNPEGFVQMFSGFLNIFSSVAEYHDKKLERVIEKSEYRVKRIQNTYNKLERLIQRSLGGAYSDTLENWRKMSESGYNDDWTATDRRNVMTPNSTSYDYSSKKGGVYMAQLERLKKQREELYIQADAERNKKNSDSSKLADYQSQIDELSDTIEYFAEDVLQELLDVDVKSWASQIGDALVDAFASGSDAAKAFNDTVSSIIKNMAKKMIALYVIEPLMKDLESYLFGKNGVFTDDYYLDPTEMAGLIEQLMKVKDGITDANKMWDIIEEAAEKAGIDLNENSSSSLGKGIQSITENTADLLASYLNAIRADVSIMRQIQQNGENNTGIFQAQLQQLNAIAQNTQRNAVAAEDIYAVLNSITYASTKGKALRV